MNKAMSEIISDYQSGMSIRRLGKIYCIPEFIIRNLLKKAGVQLRKSVVLDHSRIELFVEKIISDYESSALEDELKKYGVSPWTIKRHRCWDETQQEDYLYTYRLNKKKGLA